MAIDYGILYREFEGTLTPLDDPSDAGSQANAYGYLAGGGTTLDDKWRLFTEAQDNGTGRPITVDIRATTGPGQVREAVFAQTIQETIVFAEYDDVRTNGTPLELTELHWLELVFLSANPDAQWALTDDLQTRLNQAFSGGKWTTTKDALFAKFSRPGSRSEEMYGIQATRNDIQLAEQWRATNSPASPSLYT